MEQNFVRFASLTPASSWLAGWHIRGVSSQRAGLTQSRYETGQAMAHLSLLQHCRLA
jgi:hypothetical protein